MSGNHHVVNNSSHVQTPNATFARRIHRTTSDLSHVFELSPPSAPPREMASSNKPGAERQLLKSLGQLERAWSRSSSSAS
mmetsp:Transcript_21462/g.44902  ORF Transcript_21462/g.44902 Transcript_21462/m.44902 type:complete len:80 (-) Transcript_21462:173-412(-)